MSEGKTRRVEIPLTPEVMARVEELARPGENVFEASRRIFREALDSSGRVAWRRGYHDAMDAIRALSLDLEHALEREEE